MCFKQIHVMDNGIAAGGPGYYMDEGLPGDSLFPSGPTSQCLEVFTSYRPK